MKPNFETYRYTGEVCRLQSQSIVECRLPASEIGSILALQAKAIPTECACADGEVRYHGKLLLCLVYEDADRKICRMERGAEFYHKGEHALVTPACFAKSALKIENLTHRREGSGLYISAIVGADLCVYGSKQMEYLVGGEEICAKEEEIALFKTVCVSGETESEDEFEADYVGDILMHQETAIATSVSAGGGEIAIEGELNLNVCVLQADGRVRSYERLLPVKMQIPCEEAFDKVSGYARLRVQEARLNATVDEEKGKSKVLFSYALCADCFLTAKEEITVAQDAFCTTGELCLKKTNDGGRYLTNQMKCTERVGGTALLSPAIDGEYALQAAVNPKAELTVKRTETGADAEGVITAEVLLAGADGGYRSTILSLPFVFPLELKGEEEAEIDAIVCGLNVRRKKDGDTEAEATLKLAVKTFEKSAWEYISGAEEGEKYEESDAAISLFLPREGEELWQVAKRLKRMPEDLQKSNPELEFPVKEGAKIFVYRQIKG